MARQSEGESLFPKLFEIFRDESPKLLAQIEASFRDRDAEAAYEAIHQLKGSSAAMGATRLLELSQVALELSSDNRIFGMPELVERIRAEVAAYEACISDLLA